MNKRTKSFAQRMLKLMLLTVSALHCHSAIGDDLTFVVGGKPVVIALAQNPVITYTGNTLHVKAADKAIDLPVSEISVGYFQKHGDVNGDNTVDVADISAIITVMAGIEGASTVSVLKADANGDGTVDVADISAVISIMAGK